MPLVHAFPHWNWAPGDAKPIWAFSNTDDVELLVNGVSQGRQAMPKYGHVAWTGIPWVAGGYEVRGYAANSSTVVASKKVVTAGAPAALRISIKDDMPSAAVGGMVAGCKDVALVQVEVVDAAGVVVPDASAQVTFALSGTADATLGGTGNGDPACHVNDKSPTRPAFHGLVLAVVLGGEVPGTATVTASAPGLAPVSVDIAQIAKPAGWEAKWCHANPTL